MQPITRFKKNGFLTFTASVLVFVFVLGFFIPFTVYAAENPKIYDSALDVKAAITKAMVQAKKENKHIILMFGANWCPWCQALHKLLKSDVAIQKYLAANFILIMVDVGGKNSPRLNQDLTALYGVQKMGLPNLVVLNTEGQPLCMQSSGVLEKGEGHDPEKVMGFLKAEAPAKK